MVIKMLHTVIAYRAMRTSWWAIKHACLAIFDFNYHTINNYIFYMENMTSWPIRRDTRCVVFIFHFWGMQVTRNYARISPCCEEEKSNILQVISCKTIELSTKIGGAKIYKLLEEMKNKTPNLPTQPVYMFIKS